MDEPLLAHHEALVHKLEALVAQARHAQPDAPVPCFAHLGITTRGNERDMLLGFATVTEGPVTILNWQTAPLASVFFSTRVGQMYEFKVEGRTVEGTVRARNLLDFDRGALVEVITEDAVLSRRSGAWRRTGEGLASLLRPRASGARRLASPWTVEALDPVQRAAVELPRTRAMLVVGEAGCGKTTVALHRVAALRAQAEREHRAFRALVLVPVEGLRRLSTSLLERYGVPDADVRVFEHWAAIQARRAFPGIPRRESHDAPPAVTRLKRHPGVRDAIDEIVARPRGQGSKTASREDLLYLFGDQDLLERVAARAPSVLSPAMLRTVRQHTSVQFTDTSEREFAHVDSERLETVDGRLIDAGTPMEDAGSIDPEDYAVLFALAARRAHRPEQAPAPVRYDCVVLDEAQEFAPLELELIGRALSPGGTLIVAGDEGQQVDSTAYFAGWDATMRELGARSYETVRLAVSYRCPPSVTTVARAVLDANAVPPIDAGLPADGDVVTVNAANECHLVARLADSLNELRVRDPNALAAVICRTPEAAERMARLLGRGVDVHHAVDGDFRFEPGIEVTCVQEVKGLEFDHVVVPDVGGAVYPDDPESRRALYVAATRASEQLLFGTVKAWTALLARRGD